MSLLVNGCIHCMSWVTYRHSNGQENRIKLMLISLINSKTNLLRMIQQRGIDVIPNKKMGVSVGNECHLQFSVVNIIIQLTCPIIGHTKLCLT